MSTLSVRRPLSVLAVLAMVATLLFATVGTASAVAKPTNPALFSACPDNAGIPDAGFTDVLPGTFFADAVNCLAYYAVTTGSTPTIYDPAADVNRAQMAVFLARAAKAAGVALSATPPDAGFTDIGGQSAEVQLSINQLADVGVVKGKTATTYNPGDTVWRQQMALFLTRWLNLAIIGPGGAAVSAAATTGAPFTDISGTTVETSKAINQMWDLGLATGTGTGTTYDPLGNVNRGQMASFLTRTFGHTNVRPAGVNIQAAPVSGFGAFGSQVSVTNRSATFLPLAGTNVDTWRFDPTKTTTSAFLANGTCNLGSGTISQLQGGGTPCTLETIDPVTDPNGNWPTFTESAIDGKSSTFYAWTAALGTQFVNGVTSNYSMVTIGSTGDATDATLKVNLPKYANNPLGSPNYDVMYPGSVSWTLQLMDGPGPTAKPVAKAGVSYQFWVSRQVNALPGSINTYTLKTDAAGQIVYTVTETDPSTALGDTTQNSIWVSALGGAPGPVVPAGFDVWWSDAPAAPNTLIAATATKWMVQSNGAKNTATATLYDQYGKTMPNVPITFTSADDAAHADGIPLLPSHKTNSVGVATYGYTWTYLPPPVVPVDVMAMETITAFVTGAPGVTDFVDFFWVDKAVSGGADDGAWINMANDVGLDSAVGWDGVDRYALFKWDGGDQYFAGFPTPSSQKAFETAIKSGTTPFITQYVSPGTSQWDI